MLVFCGALDIYDFFLCVKFPHFTRKNSLGSFTEPVHKLEVITYPPKHQPHIVHYVFLDSATVPIVGGVPGYF